MFNINCRFQIAAILFLLIILFDYARHKKIPLLSTRFFSVYLGFVTVNLFSDLITVYTITHMDTVPAWVNRLAHQFFIGSLNASTLCLYFYVSILGRNQKRHDRFRTVIRFVPFAISMIAVIFGPLSYYTDGVSVAYSHGLMASTVYITSALYLVLILYSTTKYRNVLRGEQVMLIRLGTMIWILAVLVQLAHHEWLLSGLFLILLTFFLYLSFENPKEHIDFEVGCFNKRAFHLMASDMTESHKPFFVLNLVVEDMKAIHNNFGHDFGSLLLKKISHYLEAVSRARVFYSRVNCMTILYRGDYEAVQKLATQVERRFQDDFQVKENKLTVRAHFDIIECPKYAAATDEIYDIMDYMSERSDIDESFIRLINEDYITQKKRQEIIEKLIQTAIEEGGFDVFYQPIYSATDHAFSSAEALVRLRDTTTVGFVSPEEFIPIAEKKGMIMQLGEIVFRKVCRFASENRIMELGVHYIEVNLSGIQCIDNGLPTQLKNIMDDYKIDPSFINLEITETVAIESGEMLLRNMQTMRDMGCSFSMDDFGTGYSNLSKVAEVQYDLVKLDKSLIWPCFDEGDQQDKSKVILDNVINMLLQLDVKIVAEGVETVEQVNMLIMKGVDYLQGYYYSRPVRESEYLDFLLSRVDETAVKKL